MACVNVGELVVVGAAGLSVVNGMCNFPVAIDGLQGFDKVFDFHVATP